MVSLNCELITVLFVEKSKMKLHTKILLMLTLSLSANFSLAQTLPTKTFSFAGKSLSAEIAASPADRAQGLMHRQSLANNHGMLFIFEESGKHCFWMRNTPLPLTIAFIDEKGVVVNFADMQPLSEQSHCPLKNIKYALEMQQGWFKQKNIGAGAKLEGLAQLKLVK